MLDSKLLRAELDETAAKLARRGFTLDIETIRELEEKRTSTSRRYVVTFQTSDIVLFQSVEKLKL